MTIHHPSMCYPPGKYESDHSVARKHQLKIARDTLRMSEFGARIMGGMNHAEAREVLAQAGWSANRIAKFEAV
jgi:hypothetical protein